MAIKLAALQLLHIFDQAGKQADDGARIRTKTKVTYQLRKMCLFVRNIRYCVM